MCEKYSLVKERLISAPVRHLYALNPQPQTLFLGRCLFPRLSRQQNTLLAPLTLKWAVFHPARKVVLCFSQKGTQNIHSDLSAYWIEDDTLTPVNRSKFPILLQEIWRWGAGGNTPAYSLFANQYCNDELSSIRVQLLYLGIQLLRKACLFLFEHCAVLHIVSSLLNTRFSVP